MASIKKGQTDGLSGKLGNIVRYKWKDRECAREWVMPNDPRTPAQLASRKIFGKVSSLGADLLQVVRIGFRGIAAERSTTEKNVFVRLNRQHISIVDDEAIVDYTQLQVADGPLAAVDFGEPSTADGRTIRVAFSNTANANRLNYVMLVAYLPEKRNCMLSEPVFRSAGEAEINLPESWAGCTSHIYGFCWDGKDAVSPSSYIGIVNNTSD